MTDFEGVEQAAAVSRDGHFVAFLSDRDGPMDVWVTQVGSGEFHNLTHGSVPELVNPSVRTLGFSPDGSLVTFWVRKPGGAEERTSALGRTHPGWRPRPYLEGVAEFDWSQTAHASRTTRPAPETRCSCRPACGREQTHLHCAGRSPLHFPLWAPDATFIYFVQGALPDRLTSGGSTQSVEPGTDHHPQCARKPSGLIGSGGR